MNGIDRLKYKIKRAIVKRVIAELTNDKDLAEKMIRSYELSLELTTVLDKVYSEVLK